MYTSLELRSQASTRTWTSLVSTSELNADLDHYDLLDDLIGNYVNMLGYGDNHSLTEYLRLYIALHGDHEGGNASAHTARM